jgi:hypothetical protein
LPDTVKSFDLTIPTATFKSIVEKESIMLRDNDGKLKVQCLLEEYKESAECFRHTYATIWQSGIMFATFSAAIFGFFFSFQNELHIYLPYLPFISLSAIVLWWIMIFEPMNRYGDVREERCKQIEEELSNAIPSLNMRQFRSYGKAKRRFLRVRWGVRILAVLIIVLMLLLLLVFGFPSRPPLDP